MRPYLRVANVHDGFLKLDTIKEIAVEGNEAARYELKSGDVLLTEGGDNDKLGRGTVWNGEINGCLHQNHIFAVRANPDHLLPRYLAALIGSRYGRAYFDGSAKQTTNLASINASQVRGFPLVIPDTTEQARIVSVLTALAEHLTTVDALLAAKRRFKRGLAQELLTGERRFKEFEGRPWKTWHLGDLFTERSEANRPDLPLLAVTGNRGVIPRDELERRDTSNADKSKYLRIAPGDIGYNTMRMWQGVSALSALEGIVSPAYTICVPGPAIDGPFAAQLFKLPAVIHLFHRFSQGLVKDTLNLKFPQFARVPATIPELEEQRAIARVLGAVDQEIELLDELRDALDRQRRGVAELLLTGKVRVPA